jgi:hypothetical protein
MNAIVAALLVSGVTFQTAGSKPLRVAGLGYEGAIVSAEVQLSADPRHVLKPTEVWTPTEADVREAEALLPEYLNSREAEAVLSGTRIKAELRRYRRQYWGKVRDGRREILIQFFHADTSVGRRQLWLKGMLSVAGGGDQFFRVTYRVQTRAFAELRVNLPE